MLQLTLPPDTTHGNMFHENESNTDASKSEKREY